MNTSSIIIKQFPKWARLVLIWDVLNQLTSPVIALCTQQKTAGWIKTKWKPIIDAVFDEFPPCSSAIAPAWPTSRIHAVEPWLCNKTPYALC
jgi:hypothetical protein